MKKIIFLFLITIGMLANIPVEGQKVNGKTFSFPRGKAEWSDTVFKKLLTKEMAKKSIKPVVIGIRYKFVKSVDEGNWYEIEITNKSPQTKIKFKVSSNHNQDNYTVRLDPKQTKVIERLYWRPNIMNTQGVTDTDGDYINPLFDEILQERY